MIFINYRQSIPNRVDTSSTTEEASRADRVFKDDQDTGAIVDEDHGDSLKR